MTAHVSKRSLLKDAQFFTTGQAATICGISQQTIIRCVDSGRLEGFRVPGSRFRRIPRAALIDFMKENDIPLHPLVGDRKRILVIDDDEAILQTMVGVALHEPRFDIKVEYHLFGAGLVMGAFHPEIVVLGTLLPMETIKQLVEYIHRHDPTIIIMMLTPANMDEVAIQHIVRAGVSAAAHKPITQDGFVEKINDLLGLEPSARRS